MLLKKRFLLTLGLGGALLLLTTTSLVFFRMQATMVQQLEQQFQIDATARIKNLNQSLDKLTNSFQSTAKLPMFRSMRFHYLTLNKAALKNDIRQLELHIFDSMKSESGLSKVIYVNADGSEVFHVDRTGISTSLSDRSLDPTIQTMLSLKKNEFRISQENINKISTITWWIPVYVSSEKKEGVMGFTVDNKYILDLVFQLATSGAETVCISGADKTVILDTANNENCSSFDKEQWIISEKISLPGLSWKISLSVHPDTFLTEVNNIAMLVFGIIFPALAIFGFIFSFMFSNNIIYTIRKLVEAARIMGRGEQLTLVDIKRDDELGELAKEMNRSARLIENNRQELKKRNIETEKKGIRNLQAIMDHSPAVIYVKDTSGHYTFINKKYTDLFHKSREAILSKTDYDIFPADAAEQFQKNDQEVLKIGHAIEIEESVPHDESIHDYISIKFPLRDELGEIYAICGISTDITELKQQQDKVRRSQKMDALGKLTGGIAHDYNNMLGIILGYAELLENELSDKPDLVTCAHEIYRAGERGAKLTQKLLAFSRNKTSESENLNINTILSDDKNMLEKTLTARIKLVFDLADDLWNVYIDSNGFEDAIINMSINAMHAINDGGQLTFKSRNQTFNIHDAKALNVHPGNYVVLSVIDTGCGMEREILDKIFDPFYSSKGEHGTGLGLSQVYGFVESSNGSIKVYSEPGEGTRFSLYFPQYLHETKLNKLNESENIEAYGGNETILVVDDEISLLKLTSKIISNKGHQVFTAINAEQALEILKNEHIDLMISDVIMPETDGYQLAKIVQEKYPRIKIQLVSGFNDDRHLNMTDDILFNNLIHKPYTAKELMQRLNQLLN